MSGPEEASLGSNFHPSQNPRLLYASTGISTLSAYETASDFSDRFPPQDSDNEDGDNDTIEFENDESATPRHSLTFTRDDENSITQFPASAGPITDESSKAKSMAISSDVGVLKLEISPIHVNSATMANSANLRSKGDPKSHLLSRMLSDSLPGVPVPVSGASVANINSSGTSIDHENSIIPVSSHIPFDPTGMDEGTLNRIATEHSERGESIIMTRTLTNATHIDVRDLEYDDENDKANPFNWPAWKKWLVTLTVANTCLCVSLGTSLYVAAVPALMKIHKVSETLAISGVTFYLLGLALGPVMAAPLSEVYGRRWIYFVTFPASMLFAMGVGLSKNMHSILILRFFCGLVGSPPMALCAGTISDIWSNDPMDLSLAMSIFCLCPFLGPIIGPIVGGFAAEHKNWQWTMWVYLMFSGFVLPFLLAVPETFKPAILEARAKKRGLRIIKAKFNLKNALVSYLGRPLEMLVVEPIVCFTSIYCAFVFAVLFGFFEAYPIIFFKLYRMDAAVSSLPFIGVGIGLMVGVALHAFLSRKAFKQKLKIAQETNSSPKWDKPEVYLKTVAVGAVFLPISLFWLAWTSRRLIHWIVPTLAGMPFGFGLIWIFLGIVSYYAYSFPPAYVASALSANNLLRYVMAAVFPLFIVQMYTRLHIDWATSLLAFIALLMLPIPFVFIKYGEKMRLRSKYGYVAFFRAIAAEEAKANAEKSEGITPAEQKYSSLTSDNGLEV